MINNLTDGSSKFSHAGSGHYAKVFSHESGIVYKFWAKDSAYEKFIKFVESNSSNPHLPKLKSGIKTMKTFFSAPADFPDRFKYIKMEKLTPLYNAKFPGNRELYVIEVIQNIVGAIVHNRSFDSLLSALNAGKELERSAIDQITELYKILKKMITVLGIPMDIHSGNVMLRGSTIVITDPYSDNEDYEFNLDLLNSLEDFANEKRMVAGK